MIERDDPGDLRMTRAKVFRARHDMHAWLHADRDHPDRRVTNLTEDLLAQVHEWLVAQDGAVSISHIAFDQWHDDKGRRHRYASMENPPSPDQRTLDTVFPKPGDEYAMADATVYFEVDTDTYVEPEPRSIPIARNWTPSQPVPPATPTEESP